MAARGPKIPGARSSEKNPDFLKFIGPVTTLWVLQSSQNVHMVSAESLLARAVFTRLLRVLGWQPGTPKPWEHDLPKKKCPNFLKFIEPVTPLWVLYPSEITRVGFTEPLLARAVFTRSKKVTGWQPGAPNFREHGLPKKILFFLKFIGPVTTLWVLQSSQNVEKASKEFLLARAVFTRLIRVIGWQPGTPKTPGARFSEKKRPNFLKFIEPVTPLWVLYPSEIMRVGSLEPSLAKAVCTRSIRELGWQPGAPKPREHDFPEKKRPISDTSMGSVSL